MWPASVQLAHSSPLKVSPRNPQTIPPEQSVSSVKQAANDGRAGKPYDRSPPDGGLDSPPIRQATVNFRHQRVLAQTLVTSSRFGSSDISEPQFMIAIHETQHIDFTPAKWSFTIVEDLNRDTIVESIGFDVCTAHLSHPRAFWTDRGHRCLFAQIASGDSKGSCNATSTPGCFQRRDLGACHPGRDRNGTGTPRVGSGVGAECRALRIRRESLLSERISFSGPPVFHPELRLLHESYWRSGTIQASHVVAAHLARCSRTAAFVRL